MSFCLTFTPRGGVGLPIQKNQNVSLRKIHPQAWRSFHHQRKVRDPIHSYTQSRTSAGFSASSIKRRFTSLLAPGVYLWSLPLTVSCYRIRLLAKTSKILSKPIKLKTEVSLRVCFGPCCVALNLQKHNSSRKPQTPQSRAQEFLLPLRHVRSDTNIELTGSRRGPVLRGEVLFKNKTHALMFLTFPQPKHPAELPKQTAFPAQSALKYREVLGLQVDVQGWMSGRFQIVSRSFGGEPSHTFKAHFKRTWTRFYFLFSPTSCAANTILLLLLAAAVLRLRATDLVLKPEPFQEE